MNKLNNIKELIDFQIIFNLIEDALLVINEENQIIMANNQSAELFEFALDDFIGEELDKVYNPLINYDNSNIIRNVTSMLNQERELEKIITKKNGTQIKIIEKRKDFISADNNRYTLVILSDITNFVKIEEKALQASNQYLQVLEYFPALIWRTNQKGEFNYFNQTWLNFTGTAVSENINKNWFHLIHQNDSQLFIKEFEKQFNKKSDFQLEFRLKNKDDNHSWVLCRAVPYNNMHGEFAGYIGTCIDITERIEHEEQLKSAMIEAQKANQAKSTFLSNMSHELRTPLNGILGMTEVLLDFNPTKKQKEFLAVQKNSANSLLTIINSILDLAKIESGKLEIKQEEINLKDFIYSFTESQKLIIAMKGVKFYFDLGNEVPEKIICDEQKLKQILTNLTGNAIKFTEKGSIKLAVSLYDEDNNYLMFEVTDTGVGIDEKHFHKIFKSFQQVDNSYTRKFEGTGLGLAITQEFVTRLGGKIWVKSQVGVGSSFYFTIPLGK